MEKWAKKKRWRFVRIFVSSLSFLLAPKATHRLPVPQMQNKIFEFKTFKSPEAGLTRSQRMRRRNKFVWQALNGWLTRCETHLLAAMQTRVAESNPGPSATKQHLWASENWNRSNNHIVVSYAFLLSALCRINLSATISNVYPIPDVPESCDFSPQLP